MTLKAVNVELVIFGRSKLLYFDNNWSLLFKSPNLRKSRSSCLNYRYNATVIKMNYINKVYLEPKNYLKHKKGDTIY